MKNQAAIVIAAIVFSGYANASEVKELNITPSEAYGMFNVLQTLDKKTRICKDGASEKECSETIILKPGLSLLIALDLSAIKRKLDDFEYARHKLLGVLSNGTGYIEPKSKAEAEANFKSIDLAQQPLTISLSTISRKELADSKVDLSPTAQATLLSILED